MHEGLRYGFCAGFNHLQMSGHRWFRNYPSVEEAGAREAVADATQKRVAAGKTLDLGVWGPPAAAAIRSFFRASAIFPMGCVDKPLEPGVKRPTDDHTRTGFNAASDLSFLRHTLNAYEEVAAFLQLEAACSSNRLQLTHFYP